MYIKLSWTNSNGLEAILIIVRHLTAVTWIFKLPITQNKENVNCYANRL